MCKTISFNSWNEYFKAPFGALKINEGADIKVNVNDNDVYSINLIIEKEDENLKFENVRRIKKKKIPEFAIFIRDILFHLILSL